METLNPVWIGIGGTLIALALFANGWRIARRGGGARTVGRLHMVTAPLFIGVIWLVIWRMMP